MRRENYKLFVWETETEGKYLPDFYCTIRDLREFADSYAETWGCSKYRIEGEEGYIETVILKKDKEVDKYEVEYLL